jgi:hypothetical protein
MSTEARALGVWVAWLVYVLRMSTETRTLGVWASYKKGVKHVQTIQTIPQTIHKPLEKTVQTTQTIRFWGVMLKRPPKSYGLCGLCGFFQWFVDGLWNGLYGLHMFYTFFSGRALVGRAATKCKPTGES